MTNKGQWLGHNQCDQMARIIFLYLAIYYNENSPYLALNIYQSRFKNLPNTKLTLKMDQDF